MELEDAAAKKTRASAELACDVSALASVYLGGFTFEQLVRGGRVQELQPGAAARGDALFATEPRAVVPRDLLMPRVGETARRTRTVTSRDIECFTEISGDRNPLHYDESAAASTRFGGIIVQGGVTSGLLNAVVAEDLPGPGSVFLEVSWRFLAPVRPGDEITAEVEVLAAREDKPITTLRTTIENQDRVVVLDGTAVVWTEPL